VADQPWRLDEGPEWESHRIRVEPNLRRFEESFRAARWVLERDPYACSRPLFDDRTPDERIFTTRDFMEGFELVVFFEVFQSNRSCELKWTILRPLTSEEELWGT
jgi:hypothetical protein